MDNITAIAALEVTHALEGKADLPLEERARLAMENARRSWCCTNEQAQFQAACEGLARTATPDELERIKADLEGLQRASSLIHALQAGLPVDWEALREQSEAEAEDEKPEPLKLKAIWQETARV